MSRANIEIKNAMSGRNLPDYIFTKQFDGFFLLDFDMIVDGSEHFNKCLESFIEVIKEDSYYYHTLESFIEHDLLSAFFEFPIQYPFSFGTLANIELSKGTPTFRDGKQTGIHNQFFYEDVIRTSLFLSKSNRWVFYLDRNLEIALCGMDEVILPIFLDTFKPFLREFWKEELHRIMRHYNEKFADSFEQTYSPKNPSN